MSPYSLSRSLLLTKAHKTGQKQCILQGAILECILSLFLSTSQGSCDKDTTITATITSTAITATTISATTITASAITATTITATSTSITFKFYKMFKLLRILRIQANVCVHPVLHAMYVEDMWLCPG